VWRPAAAACNRRLGRQGSRPPGTTTWLRGARCDRSGCRPKLRRRRVFGERSAAPGSPKPPRWSAERRASRVMGRKAPRKRLTCRVISAFTRVFDALWHVQRVPRTHPNVSRRSAHPSMGVSEAQMQSPGAKNAPRERGSVD
jgi:hypothetical protein